MIKVTKNIPYAFRHTTQSGEYQYHMKDHLGNVRLTFTTQTQTKSYTAGFENNNQAVEANNFANYPVNGTGFVNSTPGNANTGTNSQLLNGGYKGMVGVAKSFAVMPGDQLQIQAYAKYDISTGSGSNTNYTNFVTSLLSAFNLSVPPGSEVGTPVAGLNYFSGWETGATGDESKNDAVKVFVTIVLFDKNYNFLDATYKASTGSGTLISQNYTVNEPGYAYMFVSNEHPTQVNVYFDDVTNEYDTKPGTTDYRLLSIWLSI